MSALPQPSEFETQSPDARLSDSASELGRWGLGLENSIVESVASCSGNAGLNCVSARQAFGRWRGGLSCPARLVDASSAIRHHLVWRATHEVRANRNCPKHRLGSWQRRPQEIMSPCQTQTKHHSHLLIDLHQSPAARLPFSSSLASYQQSLWI